MRSELLRARQQRYALTEKGKATKHRCTVGFKGRLTNRLCYLKSIKRCQRCGSSMIVLIKELDRRETHLECIPCGWIKYALDSCKLVEV